MAEDKWLPGKRADIILMAKAWSAWMADHASDAGIPAGKVTAFNAAITTLDEASEAEAADRSPIKVEAAKLAQTDLVEQMRFIKNHFLLAPPLTALDFVALLLKVPGSNPPNPIPKAENQAAVTEFKPLGAHLLKVNLAIIGALPEGSKKSWYNYKIYFAVIDPAPVNEPQAAWRHLSAAPQTGADLPNSVATNRSTYTFDFPETDRGKDVWFCVVLENKKHEEGHWGPLVKDKVP
ncbi:hypothetical protein FACS189468_8240 [Spirochaetia bacterium]|nr:hypothetical protein FACS189468_8240 [Spirochaetia bacterium]